MKLLTMLRRMFAIDTNEVPPFDPGRIHDLLAELQKSPANAVEPGHAWHSCSVMGPTLTAAGLADLLVKVITGVEGGTDEHWAEIIGPVHQLSIIDNVQSNWAVIPGGIRKERNVIAKAAEIIRQAHPYVNG